MPIPLVNGKPRRHACNPPDKHKIVRTRCERALPNCYRLFVRFTASTFTYLIR